MLCSLLLLSVLSACSHQAKKVDCDRRLVPINAPTPVVKPDPALEDPAP